MTDTRDPRAGAEPLADPKVSDTHVADAAIASVEQQFAVMFTRVKSTMRDRAGRVHPDLQPLGYNLLRTLVRFGPARATSLATDLNLDKSIISRQSRLLEDLGFIERLPDAGDGRAFLLAATPEAVERVDAVRVTDEALLHESLRDWDLEDLEKLAELLGRLNELGR